MYLLFLLQSYTFSAIPATILQEKCKKSEESPTYGDFHCRTPFFRETLHFPT